MAQEIITCRLGSAQELLVGIPNSLETTTWKPKTTHMAMANGPQSWRTRNTRRHGLLGGNQLSHPRRFGNSDAVSAAAPADGSEVPASMMVSRPLGTSRGLWGSKQPRMVFGTCNKPCWCVCRLQGPSCYTISYLQGKLELTDKDAGHAA